MGHTLKLGVRMIVKHVNRTTNPKWYLAHNIREAVRSLDGVARENVLLRIKAELLRDKTPNLEILRYVTDLLQGKRPCGLCNTRRKGGEHGTNT